VLKRSASILKSVKDNDGHELGSDEVIDIGCRSGN
jgi:hypothetical protein